MPYSTVYMKAFFAANKTEKEKAEKRHEEDGGMTKKGKGKAVEKERESLLTQDAKGRRTWRGDCRPCASHRR